MSKFTPTQCYETRTWLRALLRECTYLPDRQARSYLSGHVVNRFRDYAPGHKPDAILHEKRGLQLAQARKALSELRRANAGELKPLLKVLHLTYARIGKRRQQLLRPLLHNPPTTEDAVDKNPLPRLTPQHTALLLSQIKVSPPSTTRRHPRSIELKTPETNSWERPMPKKRVANLTKEWYAKMLDRTYVPLPVDEWERLRDLSMGRPTFKGSIPRRSSASPSRLLSPLEHSLGVISEKLPEATLDKTANPRHGHNLTSRFMRRCWSTVFAQCPLMTWDNKSRSWSVEWGWDVINRMKKSRTMGTDTDDTS